MTKKGGIDKRRYSINFEEFCISAITQDNGEHWEVKVAAHYKEYFEFIIGRKEVLHNEFKVDDKTFLDMVVMNWGLEQLRKYMNEVCVGFIKTSWGEW